jgi:LysM repeat protein
MVEESVMVKKLQAFGVLLMVIVVLIVLSRPLNAPSQQTAIATTAPTPVSPTLLVATPVDFADKPTLVNQLVIATAVEPTLTQTPAASPTIPPDAKMHVVQRGENVYRIAQTYGVSMDSIAAVNGLTDMSRIFVGQELWIPAANASSTPSAPTLAVTLTPTVFVPTITPILETRPTTSTTIFVTATPALTLTAASADVSALSLLPPPTTVNGVALDQFIVIPQAVRANIEVIFARGQELNRNPRAFSKLGDSTIENPFFLARFDSEPYNLGEYGYLESVINFYAGSFGRESIAVRRGLHTWSVFDPMWTASPYCQSRESLLECEVRLNNPSLIFVRLGSNDVGVPEMTEDNFRQIIEFLMNNGIIPILGTKADRYEGADNANNNIMRRLASEYNVPLWDFDLVAQTMPNRGLDQDGVHMTSFYAHDWTSPVGFQRGHGVHNLTALIALDAVWRVIAE